MITIWCMWQHKMRVRYASMLMWTCCTSVMKSKQVLVHADLLCELAHRYLNGSRPEQGPSAQDLGPFKGVVGLKNAQVGMKEH